MDRFRNITSSLEKNITEVTSSLKDPSLLLENDSRKFERVVYLFQSVTKAIIDIGNNIIIENDFRSPLNTADVFISLAEHSVIPLPIVPGLKKAAIIMPKLRTYSNSEILEAINSCIGDMKMCLGAFVKYRQSKTAGG